MNNQKCIYYYNETSNISFHLPQCSQYDNQFPILCYSFWKLIEIVNDLNSTSRQFQFCAKGCWSKDPSLCKTKLFNNNLLLCCCTGEFCNRDTNPEECYNQINQHFNNQHINYSNSIKNYQIKSNLDKPYLGDSSSIFSKDTINLLSFIILILVICTILFYLIKLLFKKEQPLRSCQNNSEDKRSSGWNKELERLLIDKNDKIELIEDKARGRFGDVFQAKLINNRIVAVKIFHEADYDSFKNELKIYRLTNFRHSNVLKFIKAEIRSANILRTPEYWLITEYKENGSLQQYLQFNFLDRNRIQSICLDIANGLAFLHGLGRCNNIRSIAHRDLKSSNILLSNKLRACIADFDLSLVFFNHKLESDTLNQVGTSRYFSPELLDGSINFSGDSLLKVDIYACALVFWEILNRFNVLQNEYRLPFQLELGSAPTINELRSFISLKRKRPLIRNEWREDCFLNVFCRTIEDCWEHDA